MATTTIEQSAVQTSGHGSFRDYIQLTKPRIALLLIFTTVTAMVLAAQGQALEPLKLAATIIGGVLASAGSSTLNQWYDRDMDQLMLRTRKRPIPSGRISPTNALIFGFALLAWSALILSALVNWLAAGLAMFGAVYYVVGYTMLLKRNTVLNILIGGGAGAMPVLVGWAAVTGTLSPAAFVLFAIVFYWTPPHSWALALLVNEDYTKANVPMMPVARGQMAARMQILLYSLQLVCVSLLLIPFRVSGPFYLVLALGLGGWLVYESIRLIRIPTLVQARRTYKYTTFYLALLFLVMMLDQFVMHIIFRL